MKMFAVTNSDGAKTCISRTVDEIAKVGSKTVDLLIRTVFDARSKFQSAKGDVGRAEGFQRPEIQQHYCADKPSCTTRSDGDVFRGAAA